MGFVVFLTLLLGGWSTQAHALSAADCRKTIRRVQQFFLDAHRKDTALYEIETRMPKAPHENATSQRFVSLQEAIQKTGHGYTDQTARDVLRSLRGKGLGNAEAITKKIFEAAAKDGGQPTNIVKFIDALDPATAKALSAHPESLGQFLHDVSHFYRVEDFRPSTLATLLRRSLLESSGDPKGLRNTMDGIGLVHREARRVAREEPALGYEAALERAARKMGIPDEVGKLLRDCLPVR